MTCNYKKLYQHPKGFVNRYLPELETRGNFLKWRWKRLIYGPSKDQEEEILPAIFNSDLIKKNSLNQENQGLIDSSEKSYKTTITWIGHSTLLLQIDGLNILTDPNFSNRASPISFLGPKRHSPLVIDFHELPKINAVLISHNHYDHLDLATVRKLMQQEGGPPKFFVPLRVEYWFAKNVEGAILKGEMQNVIAMDWGDSFKINGQTAPVKLEFLAVQHWSARSINDRNQTLWGSFAVLSPKFRFWFSGDLGYSQDTIDIGKHLKNLDLAAISIGSYEPRWFMKNFHINPKEAIQVMQDVKTKKALAIHFGTFDGMSDEPLDKPIRDLKRELKAARIKADRFIIPKHGETFVF